MSENGEAWGNGSVGKVRACHLLYLYRDAKLCSGVSAVWACEEVIRVRISLFVKSTRRSKSKQQDE
eukprot:scaffold166928_cov27-Tisochrysis_lutea.AAC.2